MHFMTIKWNQLCVGVYVVICGSAQTDYKNIFHVSLGEKCLLWFKRAKNSYKVISRFHWRFGQLFVCVLENLRPTTSAHWHTHTHTNVGVQNNYYCIIEQKKVSNTIQEIKGFSESIVISIVGRTDRMRKEQRKTTTNILLIDESPIDRADVLSLTRILNQQKKNNTSKRKDNKEKTNEIHTIWLSWTWREKNVQN